MKRILLIGTGGTIASAVTESGLAPELTTSQLLAHLPVVSDICQVECLQLLNLDSTNVGPRHWKLMSRCIRQTTTRMTDLSLPTEPTPWPILLRR